jgi:hypothetical protein
MLGGTQGGGYNLVEGRKLLLPDPKKCSTLVAFVNAPASLPFLLTALSLYINIRDMDRFIETETGY